METAFGLKGDWETWERIDTAFLTRCDEFWVYTLPGWRESVGIKAESIIAENRGMPFTYVSEGEALEFIRRAKEVHG